MKKLLLIITLLCIVIVSNSYNYPTIAVDNNKFTYNDKTYQVVKGITCSGCIFYGGG